jgi:uncharacterized membrane protein
VTTAEDTAAPPTPDVRANQGRTWALAAVAALVLLGLAWELWLAPTGRGTLALKVLPLMLCVQGLLLHRLFTYRALSLLVWLYVLEGVFRASVEGGWVRWLGATEALLALALFAVCSAYIRHRLRSASATRNPATGPAPAENP